MNKLKCKDKINEYTGSNNEEKKKMKIKKINFFKFWICFQYFESAPSNKHLQCKVEGRFHICIRILSEFESFLK